MNEDFLEKIIEITRERVRSLKSSTDVEELRSQAIDIRSQRRGNQLHSTLSKKDQTNIIAEIKRASPSKGIINDRVDVALQARSYKDGGASAISVLTEEKYFKGSIDDLIEVRSAVDLPLLRKDFTIDELQIYEAACAGADAVLLIIAALRPKDLKDFQTLANQLGMDALVEVHTANDLQTAADIGAKLIGVNNRNLRTFEVSLDVSRKLIKNRPPGALMIAESGISSADEINELKMLGFDGFLVGESLMRANETKQMLEALI